MKKSAILALLAGSACLTAAVLSGCGSNPAIPDQAEVVVSDIELPSEVESVSESEAETAYTLTEQVLEKKDLKLNYYELVSETDTIPVDECNRILNKDVKLLWAQIKKNYASWSGEISCESVKNDTCLSVIYSGTMTSSKGKTKHIIATTNIDLNTGKRLSTGISSHAETVAAAILNDEVLYMEQDSEDLDELKKELTALSQEELTKLLKECDFTDASESLPEGYSYLLDDDPKEYGVYLPVSASNGTFALLLVSTENLTGSGTAEVSSSETASLTDEVLENSSLSSE